MIELTPELTLHAPRWNSLQRGDLHLFLDPERPHWAAVDERGAFLLSRIDGRTACGRLLDDYRARFGRPAAKAWVEVNDFLRDALRHGLVAVRPFAAQAYPGRASLLKPTALRELWLHLLQTCNISCTHCLVSSGPQGEKGADSAFFKSVMEQGAALGVHRFYFTGGEPMVRPDFAELARFVTADLGAELIVLTNATLASGERLEALKSLDRAKVRFQVSLDGAGAPVNDAIRGAGVFASASAGLKTLAGLGFATSLTAAVTRANVKDLEGLPGLAKELGAGSLHLMWLHKRGRAAAEAGFPAPAELTSLYRKVRAACAGLGVRFDNEEAFLQRLRGTPGVKYDLSNACWESLAVYHDGGVYPTAATAGHGPLLLGSARDATLESLWRDSPAAREWRGRSVADMAAASDPFRFLTGGGDAEHAYFFSGGKADPYYPVYVSALKDAMEALGRSRADAFNRRSGYGGAVVWYAMGEEPLACEAPGKTKEWLSAADPVRTLHSNCVLSFDVHKPYRVIAEFYGDAADAPQAELCCPVKYDAADTAHIPPEVLERFYGCGSPVGSAGLRPGETFADLGSGGGIDCFIAAKKVGPQGRVVGVDMTDRMLAVANRNRPLVAAALGYANVEFRKGTMESCPLEDASVDCLSSNCVLNLSPDKRRVFAQMWRVLKDHGRICVSDIVSEVKVPAALQADERLWGECITGALSEEEFLSELERAGFYGLRVLKKTYWKTVQGFAFHSVTVTAHKFLKTDGCRFVGQKAVYLGPWKSVVDEEGHLFPRNTEVEVCTDTAAKLAGAPYAGSFRIVSPGTVLAPVGAAADGAGCDPSAGCC